MAILGYDNCKLETREFGIEGMLKRRGFDGWLEVTVDDLATPARERIARELETHYAEAVSAYLTSGISEMDAKAAALSDLGDPTEAAKRFRRRHLTEQEYNKWFRFIERRAAKPLISFGTLFCDILPLIGIATLCTLLPGGIGYPWLLALCLLLIFICFRLIPSLLFNRTMPASSRLRGYALCYLLALAGMGIGLSQMGYSRHHDIFITIYAPCMFVPQWFGLLRILFKLRNSGEAANEMPPKATAAS